VQVRRRQEASFKADRGKIIKSGGPSKDIACRRGMSRRDGSDEA
jgi:hypothetical protein